MRSKRTVVKVVITFLFIILSYFAYGYIAEYFIPQTSADLAIQQVNEDGSREQMRIQEFAQNWFDPLYIGGSVIVIFLLWIKEMLGPSKSVVNVVKKE